MLANGLNQLGFTWVCNLKIRQVNIIKSKQASSPACTELEAVVMDWLAKMLGLPNDFLHSHADTTGGGVIQVRSMNI